MQPFESRTSLLRGAGRNAGAYSVEHLEGAPLGRRERLRKPGVGHER